MTIMLRRNTIGRLFQFFDNWFFALHIKKLEDTDKKKTACLPWGFHMYFRMYTIAMATLLAIASATLVADPYQVEVKAGLSQTSADSAFGAYYFLPLESNPPALGDSAYLDDKTSVFANVLELNSPFYHGNLITAGIDYFVPNSIFYVGGDLAEHQVDGLSSRIPGFHDSVRDWRASAGISIRGLLIKTSYQEENGYDPNVTARYVTGFGRQKYINIEASSYEYDQGKFISVTADYFFDPTLSFGIQYLDDHLDALGYGLRAGNVFTMPMGGNVTYTNSSESSDVFSLNAKYRF